MARAYPHAGLGVVWMHILRASEQQERLLPSVRLHHCLLQFAATDRQRSSLMGSFSKEQLRDDSDVNPHMCVANL